MSSATNLVPGDTNARTDVFVRHLACDGNVVAYCTSQPNSLGCTPAISAAGSPSASAGSGFTITATGVVPGGPGHSVRGPVGPTAVPFGGGTLCTREPFRRAPSVLASGDPACDAIRATLCP